MQGSKIQYSMTSLLRLSMLHKACFQHPFTAFHKPKTTAKQGINPMQVIFLSDVLCNKNVYQQGTATASDVHLPTGSAVKKSY